MYIRREIYYNSDFLYLESKLAFTGTLNSSEITTNFNYPLLIALFKNAINGCNSFTISTACLV